MPRVLVMKNCFVCKFRDENRLLILYFSSNLTVTSSFRKNVHYLEYFCYDQKRQYVMEAVNFDVKIPVFGESSSLAMELFNWSAFIQDLWNKYDHLENLGRAFAVNNYLLDYLLKNDCDLHHVFMITQVFCRFQRFKEYIPESFLPNVFFKINKYVLNMMRSIVNARNLRIRKGPLLILPAKIASNRFSDVKLTLIHNKYGIEVFPLSSLNCVLEANSSLEQFV